MKKILGWFILSIPFILLFILGVFYAGLQTTLEGFGFAGIVGGIVALCCFIGVNLIKKGG